MTPGEPGADVAGPGPRTIDAPPEAPAPADVPRLAALHGECLPDSLVWRLGPSYTRAFYRYLARSGRERVLVARVGGRVVGACVLSLDPGSLTRRLALRTPLLPAALRGLFRPGVARSLLGTGGRAPADGRDDPPRGLPEVLLIFTAAEARGRGVGSSLLAACERSLADRGLAAYVVRTVDDEANPALAFYARNGFQPCGRSFEHGRWFRVLKKAPAAAADGSAGPPSE